jgi:hypothetical protein
MKEIEGEWKEVPLSGRIEKDIATKSKPVGTIVVLAGVTSGSLFLFAGSIAKNAVQKATLSEVGVIIATALTGSTAKVFDAATRMAAADNVLPTLVLAGSALSLIKIGKSIIEKRHVAKKARKISLVSNLKDSTAPGTLPSLFSDHTEVQAKLDKISRARQNLLSHLSGGEIRLFLQGDDKLRTEILAARPPSYEQRLACTYALDKNLFKRWIDEQILVGTAWDDVTSKAPASLRQSILDMREESSRRAPDIVRDTVLARP